MHVTLPTSLPTTANTCGLEALQFCTEKESDCTHVFLPTLQRGADAGLERQRCGGALQRIKIMHLGISVQIHELEVHLRAKQTNLDGGSGRGALDVTCTRRYGNIVLKVSVESKCGDGAGAAAPVNAVMM